MGIALENELKPLRPLLDRPDVTEISINKPGEAFVESGTGITRHAIETLTYERLMTLVTLIASWNGQSINETTPLLSGSLPAGERVQVVIPPCVMPGRVALSIRKPTLRNCSLDTYEQAGALDNTVIGRDLGATPEDRELAELLRVGSKAEFLRQAVRYRKNIVISGGTSTGKTTFSNALIQLIPHEERLITIEDTREAMLPQPNVLHLLASKGTQGTARVGIQDLLEACLRLRPDRLFLSELRGSEAFSFLRAVNTGHPGSITTLHADTPRGAFEQLVLMVTQAGLGLSRPEILDYIHSVVEVVVQLKRIAGQRIVSEIYFEHLNKA